MPDEISPSEQYLRQIQWSGFGWLLDHELLGETYWDKGAGARWCVGKKGTFVHRCEIIAGIGGSLVVHGDFDTVRFAHYGDHPDAWNRLQWMAKHKDVGYYVAQKAAIGAGHGRDEVHHYDSDVAEKQIGLELEAVESCGDREREARILKCALNRVEFEEELSEFLHSAEAVDFALWDHRFGRVLDAHVIIGHLALQRCMYLLVDKYGWEGPPECRG